jgi:hypothetical protein
MKQVSRRLSLSKTKVSLNKDCIRGFSFVEVMAGILLSLTFTGIAMQALVASAYLKVKGQEEGESSVWIQENVEFIRHIADKLDYQNNSYEVNLLRCQSAVEETGYGDRLRDELSKIEFGDADIPNNSSSENDKEFNVHSSRGSRPYVIRRQTRVKTTQIYAGDPYFNILEVQYNVFDDQGKLVSGSYVEFIPEVSLRCPQ